MRFLWGILALCLVGAPARVLAHASEQGFVLLLPTGLYMAGGVATVALTVVMIAVVPARVARRVFRPWRLWRVPIRRGGAAVSLVALGGLGWAVWRGWVGAQDPTQNPLPLIVWGFVWLFVVTAQGVFGDMWRVINPWTGLWRVLGARVYWQYPRALGQWPGVVVLLALAGFLLADIAPAAPERLAGVVAVYWAIHMAGVLAFGPRWLFSVEAVTILMRAYADLAVFGRACGRRAIGFSAWRSMSMRQPTMGVAVFMILALAIGSFDGVNETFWWFGVIGVNPLEFSGRSSVVWHSLAGLILACVGLLAVFAATLRAGLILAESDQSLGRVFRTMAPSILPIAFGYHVAHYLPTMLVDVQYLAFMANDPMGRGADLFGLAGGHVTTGFFNTQASVRVIWLTQAGAVVFGHVVAILMAHVLALRLFGTPRKATLSQLPLTLFMVSYTLFGLWLLASPRGG